MNNFKKVLITLFATVTAGVNVLGLGACGAPKATGDVEVVAYDGSPVTITFEHCMGQTLQAAVEQYVPEFNKIYPNIKVEISKGAANYDKLLETLSNKLTGANKYLPSVAYCYPDHVATYKRGKKVVALDPYINSKEKVADTEEIMGLTEEQVNDYFKIFYDEGSQYDDGKTYSLPFYKSTEVLYYNKTFFDANNLTVPTTWEEMEAVCESILKIDKTCIPMVYDSESNWFITMTEQLKSGYTTTEGDKNFVFDNETNRDFVKTFSRWYKSGYVTTQEINGGSYGSKLFNLIDTKDKNEINCYMCIGSTGGASYQVAEKVNINGVDQYPFEIGIAQIPQADKENQKVIQQGPSICLFKKDNPQEVAAAWLFAKYFTGSSKFQAYSSLKNGYTPVIKSAMDEPGYVAMVNGLNAAQGKDKNAFLTVNVVQQTITQMDTYFTSAVFKGSSEARKKVGSLMQSCFVYSMKEGTDTDKYIADQFKSAVSDLEKRFG